MALHPRPSRRTVACLLAERGVNQRIAMEVLGDSNIAATANYYEAIRPEALKAVVVKLHPPQARKGAKTA